MAKRRGRPKGSGRRSQTSPNYESVMGRMRSWIQEREELAKDFRALADSLSTAVVQGPPPSIAPLQGAGAPPPRKRRKMSAEARAKISAAAKARWAAERQGSAKKAKKAKSAW
jgi:hypothetical protein